MKVLLAGVGNIFLGDDGFGVEVARRLLCRTWPEGVTVRDFGIRGLDLAYALERCDAAVIVDAIQLGEAPGTLSVIEPDVSSAGAGGAPEPHAMTPARVLEWLRGARLPGTLRVVGCEPETFGPEDEGQLGLSTAVQGAIDRAVLLVERLVREVLAGEIAAGDAARQERARA